MALTARCVKCKGLTDDREWVVVNEQVLCEECGDTEKEKADLLFELGEVYTTLLRLKGGAEMFDWRGDKRLTLSDYKEIVTETEKMARRAGASKADIAEVKAEMKQRYEIYG